MSGSTHTNAVSLQPSRRCALDLSREKFESTAKTPPHPSFLVLADEGRPQRAIRRRARRERVQLSDEPCELEMKDSQPCLIRCTRARQPSADHQRVWSTTLPLRYPSPWKYPVHRSDSATYAGIRSSPVGRVLLETLHQTSHTWTDGTRIVSAASTAQARKHTAEKEVGCLIQFWYSKPNSGEEQGKWRAAGAQPKTKMSGSRT